MPVKPWEPLGDAMLDYSNGNMAATVYIKCSVEADRAVPVGTFFREKDSFPKIEKDAFRYCKGKILDAGAGAGPHALYLQRRGFDITAIDISDKAVTVMQKQGLTKAVCTDVFEFDEGKYDTILMMMNGIGVAGDLQRLSKLLAHLKKLLKPGGKLLFDSTDIGYVSQLDRSMASLKMPAPEYYGIAWYQLEYKGKLGDKYPWLFIDRNTLNKIALENRYHCQVLKMYKNQYLASMEPF